MAKPSVLMLIQQFRPVASGAELQAERLGTELADSGHKVRVVTKLKDPFSKVEERYRGMDIVRTPYPLPYMNRFENASSLFRYLLKKRNSYDILHSHQCFAHAVVASVAAFWLRKKSIIKIACTGEAGDLFQYSSNGDFNKAFSVLKKTDRFVAISRDVRKELLEYGFPDDRIVMIPNGVDTDEFSYKRPDKDFSDKFRFILVGRRTPQKGIDIALEAMKILKSKNINAELVMYGWDYNEHDYRAYAKSLNVEDIVSFKDFDSDVLGLYRKADCLILPSRGEGLSNVMLESMSCGLPVIVSDAGGNVDVVKSGENGFIFENKSSEKLAECMAAVYENPEMKVMFSEKAYKTITSSYSLKRVAEKYSELYDELCR
jgi:glycosyltransferase involved in cell wall biosynthesis